MRMETSDRIKNMRRIARELTAEGKGILAADESTGTIGKRFSPIGVENNSESRRQYRELLFTTRMHYFLSHLFILMI